jgi:hypothetical protein
METVTGPGELIVGDASQLERLLIIRAQVGRERELSATPALERALQMADYALCLALGYFGYPDQLFPEQGDTLSTQSEPIASHPTPERTVSHVVS